MAIYTYTYAIIPPSQAVVNINKYIQNIYIYICIDIYEDLSVHIELIWLYIYMYIGNNTPLSSGSNSLCSSGRNRYVHLNVLTYVCMLVYMYIHIYKYIYVNIYVYMFKYVNRYTHKNVQCPKAL
jgi:hypothetical protein